MLPLGAFYTALLMFVDTCVRGNRKTKFMNEEDIDLESHMRVEYLEALGMLTCPGVKA